jgi:hypothetical protein
MTETELDSGINWESAHDFIERQTVRLERMYHSSRPQPRNRAMGFKNEKHDYRKRKAYQEITGDYGPIVWTA